MSNPDFGHLSDREILIVVATEQSTIQARLNEHGKRLKALEWFAGTATGGLAVIGAVMGWVKINAKIQ